MRGLQVYLGRNEDLLKLFIQTVQGTPAAGFVSRAVHVVGFLVGLGCYFGEPACVLFFLASTS